MKLSVIWEVGKAQGLPRGCFPGSRSHWEPTESLLREMGLGDGGPYLAILSVQDMVTSCSPSRMPSHVCSELGPRTGTVPSLDSILVRRCPRNFLMMCLLLLTRR